VNKAKGDAIYAETIRADFASIISEMGYKSGWIPLFK
jgi:hypothetical protein